MRKAVIIILASTLAVSMKAQPNGNGNSNLSNVFLNVSNNNVSNNSNINIQQASNSNVNKPKPKPTTVNQTRRRTLAITTPKPKPANTVAHSSTGRTRRTLTRTTTAAITPSAAQIQNNPPQEPSQDNVTVSNVVNVQEFSQEMPQQQMVQNNFNPIQTNEQNVNEDNANGNMGISVDLPTFKKPQIYFSYADLSVSHKSVSLKKMISTKMLKISRKHKAKHGGKIKRYITHNCCKWN